MIGSARAAGRTSRHGWPAWEASAAADFLGPARHQHAVGDDNVNDIAQDECGDMTNILCR